MENIREAIALWLEVEAEEAGARCQLRRRVASIT
ncbi:MULTISPECIES: hypothetical protein [unclassified Cyanobium]|nr:MULTISPECIES: hypothetical protein [unclassified Cyanobium]